MLETTHTVRPIRYLGESSNVDATLHSELLVDGIDPGSCKDGPTLLGVKSAEMLMSGLDPGSSKDATIDIVRIEEIDPGSKEIGAAPIPAPCLPLPSSGSFDDAVSTVAIPNLGLTELRAIAVDTDPDPKLVELAGKNVGVKAVVAADKGEYNGVHGADIGHISNDSSQATAYAVVRRNVDRSGSSHRRRSLPGGVHAIDTDSTAKWDAPTPLSDSSQSARSHKRSRHDKHRSSSSAKRSRSKNDLVDNVTELVMNLESAEAAGQPHQGH
ncbi:hypothetical protein V6N11_055509 [Hibiscus sabdariffa]|uniref:Uncharacterized protein n=1 Tax=Hibiscus sabdariffa TaxID=183260 RepID=A0ABR2NQS2_9ROSI